MKRDHLGLGVEYTPDLIADQQHPDPNSGLGDSKAQALSPYDVASPTVQHLARKPQAP